MQMQKKSQISIFILIGVVLVIIISVTYYFLSLQTKGFQPEYFSESSPVESYVSDCINSQLQISIFRLGIHGGYAKPKHTFSGEFFDTSYLYYEGEDLSPSTEDMENTISYYLNTSIPAECNLSLFKDTDITAGKVDARAKITDSKIIADIDWPIEIKTGSETKYINKFAAQHELDLPAMSSFAKNIVQNQEPGKLDILSLLREGYNTTIVPENNDLVYLIKDLDSEVLDEHFMFVFAAKFR